MIPVSRVIRQHGKTIQEVANIMGVSRGTLANTIGGNMTISTLTKIANAIGCYVYEFFLDDLENTGNNSSHGSTEFICPHCGQRLKVVVK